MKTVALSGIGCITPYFDSISEMAQHFRKREMPSKKEIVTIALPETIKIQDQRRMAKISRIALYAANQAMACAGASGLDCAVYIGLTHGSTSLLQEFHDYWYDHGPELVSPNAFSSGVTGAALGTISRFLGCTLGGTTFVGYESAGLDALNNAAWAVLAGTYPRCLAGAAEEYSPHVESVYRALGWYPGTSAPCLPTKTPAYGVAEGGVFFFCEKPGERELPLPQCLYEPFVSIESMTGAVDCIISCAGGGPQDVHESAALKSILARTGRVPILFVKPFLGESFAVSPLLAVAMAGDMLRNRAVYPSFPVCGALAEEIADLNDPASIKRILILAASRSGDVSAGIVSMFGG